LSQALNEQGFDVSKSQVCQLLHELGYQLSANRKSLEGGTHPDTAEFAVESIRRWWKYLGKELYPDANDIFITTAEATGVAAAFGNFACRNLRMKAARRFM